MSRNGSGTYNLPAGNPVVSGSTITSAWANTTLTDIASALTGSLASDGQTPASGDLNMGNNQIKSMADPTLAQDATTKTYVDTAITVAVAAAVANVSSVVTGSIQMWPTVTAPSGYLLCAGSAVSRSTYSALFAVIGTTFGVGDGSTTFNLPNYSDRMPIGSGTAALAATGGSKDAVVVSHTHTASVDTASLTGTIFANGNRSAFAGATGIVTASGSTGSAANQTNIVVPDTVTINASHSHTVTNASAGVSGTNANLPPYLSINFIIKV